MGAPAFTSTARAFARVMARPAAHKQHASSLHTFPTMQARATNAFNSRTCILPKATMAPLPPTTHACRIWMRRQTQLQITTLTDPYSRPFPNPLHMFTPLLMGLIPRMMPNICSRGGMIPYSTISIMAIPPRLTSSTAILPHHLVKRMKSSCCRDGIHNTSIKTTLRHPQHIMTVRVLSTRLRAGYHMLQINTTPIVTISPLHSFTAMRIT
jgi:hypothetical protein